jgi:hypothetical protein
MQRSLNQDSTRLGSVPTGIEVIQTDPHDENSTWSKEQLDMLEGWASGCKLRGQVIMRRSTIYGGLDRTMMFIIMLLTSVSASVAAYSLGKDEEWVKATQMSVSLCATVLATIYKFLGFAGESKTLAGLSIKFSQIYSNLSVVLVSRRRIDPEETISRFQREIDSVSIEGSQLGYAALTVGAEQHIKIRVHNTAPRAAVSRKSVAELAVRGEQLS